MLDIDTLGSAIPTQATYGASDTSTPFVSWAFTRNAAHCERLLHAQTAANGVTVPAAVDGCSVVDEGQVGRDGFLTYCERVYFNPATGLGPDYETLLPARLYHVRVEILSATVR